MSNIKKLMMSAAGGEALNVEDVFSTYLYTGNSASQPINNGVDLAGQGGMVWLKARSASYNNIIVDSERGSSNGTAFNPLFTNLTNAENTAAGYGVTSFDDDGFTLGPSGQQSISNQGGASYGDQYYDSWTFRKAPKFFDVVTYTGNGSSQTIAHNLGSVPGTIMVKATSSTANWAVWHRTFTATQQVQLNTTSAALGSATVWNSTLPTDSVFSVGNYFNTNSSGVTYVAYLFAHNDGDGEFGPDGDADIIKCGSYTGNNNYPTDPIIDLGFEPQWLLIKSRSSSGSWYLFDNMMGMTADGASGDSYLLVDQAQTEVKNLEWVAPTSRGFRLKSQNLNSGGTDYIYMAIRRGPMAVPESATEVFEPVAYTGNGQGSVTRGSNTIDMALMNFRTLGAYKYTTSRLTGNNRTTITSDGTDEKDYSVVSYDTMNGWYAIGQATWNSSGITYITHQWKRAPGFFDVVTYTGDGVAGRTVSHNLGVAPEMIWAKGRSIAQNWAVYNPNGKVQLLNQTGAEYSDAVTDDYYGNGSSVIAPTATEFTIGSASPINNNRSTYIAYLFATLPGISKVGSYTGNGSSQTIDCGFTAGARFVLIKRTDSTGHWNIFDTARGIVSSQDPRFELNTNFEPEDTGHDYVDPANSGFIVNYIANDLDDSNINGANYIFYAVA